jgi:transforming growth factor-beta-induced protein
LLPDSYGTVVSALAKRYDYSSLVGAVANADLVDALNGAASVTIFAPTNAAFTAASAKIGAAAAADVKTILQYHVTAAGKFKAADLAAQQAVNSLVTGAAGCVPANDQLFVTKGDAGVQVNGGAKVVDADIIASNGVIHGINQLVFPDKFGLVSDAVAKRYDLSTLLGIVTDEAVNDAGADLLGALTNADATLTTFAPTNAAFTAINSVVDGLTQAQVNQVVQLHVLGSEVLSSAITTTPASEASVLGPKVTVQVQSSQVNVAAGATTDAKVSTADIVTQNGVIHIITKVLVPNL